MNQTKLAELSSTTEAVALIDALSTILQESHDPRQELLTKQIKLSTIPSHGVRYDANDILTAARLYFSGRQGYRVCREVMTLPSSAILKKHLGGLGTVGSDAVCRKIVEAHLKQCTSSQRFCSIKFEVYKKHH